MATRAQRKAAVNVWTPRPITPRAERVGPLQEIRTEIESEGAHGWTVVAQEQRALSGGTVWKISLIHPVHHRWDGVLPFTSDTGFVPCHTAYDEAARDMEIARLARFVVEPLYPDGIKYRDFRCSSCGLTERDGGTDRPAGKVCVYCGK